MYVGLCVGIKISLRHRKTIPFKPEGVPREVRAPGRNGGRAEVLTQWAPAHCDDAPERALGFQTHRGEHGEENNLNTATAERGDSHRRNGTEQHTSLRVTAADPAREGE